MGKGATAGAGRQEFVTATWLEWRRRLAPFVPTVADQIQVCRAFGRVFDDNRLVSLAPLTEIAIKICPLPTRSPTAIVDRQQLSTTGG